MKKRILCVILAVLMLLPFVLTAQATGSEDPSIAIWVNGSWVAAKSLSGMSGDLWVELPIDAAVLKDSGEGTGATNYVRITSNVANGSTDDTKLVLCGSSCGWSNTYISHNWWVDSDWASLSTVNADLAIEGWNGTQWIRIHNDHDCVADTSLTLGKVSASDYQGYARNIWTENNTLSKYTNFRVRVHVKIGTNLTVATGDILNLFPAANYHECVFCATCGGCTNANCTLHHTRCTCGQDEPTPEDPPVQENANPSIAAYVNGAWVSAVSVKELSGEVWVELPIDGTALKDSGEGTGATNYVRITSNVANGSTADSQINLLCSACGWSNTFVTHNWWVDDGWTGLETVNADIAIEGWDGTKWTRIHNDHDCTGDVSKPLGMDISNVYHGYVRNIWVEQNTLSKYTNFRVRVHCSIGTALAENEGDIANLFPAENYRDCAFCATCGGCTSANCTLHHVLCTCTPACTHENTELRGASSPDCTNNGYSGDTYCKDCGILLTEGDVLTALGHDYIDHEARPASCVEIGWNAYQTCSRCDYTTYEEIEALGHNFVDGKCTRCEAEDPDYEAKDPCEGYTDIDRNSWYHTAADFVIKNGYMGSTKTDAMTFEPTTKVSRAMVASIMYRIAGSPDVEYKGSFTDVADGKWFTKAIEWAAQNGLASGKGDGKFDPNGNVTRQELAIFMYKLAEHLGQDVSGRADLSKFSDEAKVPSWAKTYVQWAVSAGLISGKGTGDSVKLAPVDNATRAEFASIIMRFLSKTV